MNLKDLLVITSLAFSSVAVADNSIIGAPKWATPERGLANENNIQDKDKKQKLLGSNQQYSQNEIDDKFSAPDWFPEQHDPMPEIVKFGKKPKVWACASCHLASGLGHPESSTLSGLSETYMVQQLEDFASGKRVDYSGHMNRMAAFLTKAEMQEVSKWFASLKTASVITVKEVQFVPKTYVDETRMRQIDISEPSEEPIGSQIIEVPKDKTTIHKRAPYGEFISYVPIGSIQRGEALVKTGNGKTIPCASCHGAKLNGSTIGPAIAGNFGIYTVRQLHGFKGGTRSSSQSVMMAPVVASLSDSDIIDIAAYLSSLTL